MLRSNFYYLLLLALPLVVACGQETDAETEENNATTEETITAAPEYAGEVFGEGEADNFQTAISLAELHENVAGLTDGDSVEVTVHATVDEVCQNRGCWMTLGEEGDMMVRFKDYGFFMPMDIAGREVIAEGKAYYQITPVDELRHYAEDAGESPEAIAAITEPKRELRFLASGVLLIEEPAGEESH